MNSSILSRTTKKDLVSFIEDWSNVSTIDKYKALTLALESIRYTDRTYDYFPVNPLLPARDKPFKEVESRWYKSVDLGAPDYWVYDDQYILSDIWACWVRYSRSYLRMINDAKSLSGTSIVNDMKDVKVVVDLGNGFGYTTAALKEMFPQAKVYGTNFEGCTQWELASINADRYGFTMVPDVSHIPERVDLVFASEYLEHIHDPIAHMTNITDLVNPRYLVLASSFGTKSIGHFDSYIDNGKKIAGSKMGRAFNTALRNMDYVKVQTKCWNNKPAYWKRNEP
jgi:2-polyprenyl-3-methyl-5-hydroxy-6-metoxy-1,4-benzoquinol methylase